jgi:hypothetical protein
LAKIRPQSIIWFERLYLAGLALEFVAVLLFAPEMMDRARADGFEYSRNMLLFGAVAYAVNLLIALLVWEYAAHKASNVARWIAVYFLASDVIAIPIVLTMAMLPVGQKVFIAINGLLAIGALVFLFRPDARQWFAKE